MAALRFEAIDWKAVFLAGKNYVDWVRITKVLDNSVEMERARETLQIPPDWARQLRTLPREVHIVAFAEDSSVDVRRFVPVLQRMAESSERISIRYVSRESFPDIFIRYLTNGAESLPKFIFLNDEFTECGNWGPLPSECKTLIARGRACNNVSKAREKVTSRLAADSRSLLVMGELMELIQVASATAIEPEIVRGA